MLLALVLLAPAWVAAKMPEVRVGGWGRLVPTAVVACLPMDVEAWLDGRLTDWASKELYTRYGQENPGWLGARILAWRVAKRWRLNGAWEVAILDTSRLGLPDEPPIARALPARAVQGTSIDWPALDLCWVIPDVLSPDIWSDLEGIRLEPIGSSLVVAAPRDQMLRIKGFVDVLASDSAQHDTATFESITIFGSRYVGDPATEDRVRSLGNFLAVHIAPDGWKENGGDDSSEHVAAGRFMIRGPASTRERCGEVLSALQACSIEHPLVETGDLSIVSLRELQLLPDVIVSPLADETIYRHRKILVASVDSEMWLDNGGDQADLHFDPWTDKLVLSGNATLRRRAVDLTLAIVECHRDQKPRRLGAFPKHISPTETVPQHIAIWPIWDQLRGRGVMTTEQILAWVAEDPQARHRSKGLLKRGHWGYGIEGQSPQTGHKEAEDGLMKAIRSRVSVLENDGKDDSTTGVAIIGHVLVMWTTTPEHIDAMGAAIRELDMNQPAKP